MGIWVGLFLIASISKESMTALGHSTKTVNSHSLKPAPYYALIPRHWYGEEAVLTARSSSIVGSHTAACFVLARQAASCLARHNVTVDKKCTATAVVKAFSQKAPYQGCSSHSGSHFRKPTLNEHQNAYRAPWLGGFAPWLRFGHVETSWRGLQGRMLHAMQ
jgi:hypothetical protein